LTAVFVTPNEEQVRDGTRALELVFERDPEDTKAAFHVLAKALSGECNEADLLALVLAPVTVWVLGVGGVRLIPRNDRQLVDLSKRLERLAAEVEPLAESFLTGILHLDDLRLFPERARAAAKDLKTASADMRKKPGPARWARVREQEAVLLDFMLEKTGSDHHEEVGMVLLTTFLAFTHEDQRNLEKRYDPEALVQRRKRLNTAPRSYAWMVPGSIGLLLRATNP
jgi:hypothetical protein